MTRSTFPEHSIAPTDLFAEMESARRGDVDWKRGRLGLYMHYAGEDVLDWVHSERPIARQFLAK